MYTGNNLDLKQESSKQVIKILSQYNDPDTVNSLDLRVGNLKEAQVISVADQLSRFANLQVVALHGGSVSTMGAKSARIITALPKSVETIKIWGLNIDKDDAESLIKALNTLPKLRSLTLLASTYFQLSAFAIQIIGALPKTIESIRICGCGITADDAHALALGLGNLPRLRSLEIVGNKIGAGAAVIVNALPREMSYIDFNGCDITEEYVPDLAKALSKLPDLRSLKMWFNEIGAGVIEIFKATPNLELFYLDGCKIPDESYENLRPLFIKSPRLLDFKGSLGNSTKGMMFVDCIVHMDGIGYFNQLRNNFTNGKLTRCTDLVALQVRLRFAIEKIDDFKKVGLKQEVLEQELEKVNQEIHKATFVVANNAICKPVFPLFFPEDVWGVIGEKMDGFFVPMNYSPGMSKKASVAMPANTDGALVTSKESLPVNTSHVEPMVGGKAATRF